jgi:hypothetical protein
MVFVKPDELDEAARALARVRANLLEARGRLLGPTSDLLPVAHTDTAVQDFVDRCQRGLIGVAEDLDFTSRALVAAAATWRETERSVGKVCRP